MRRSWTRKGCKPPPVSGPRGLAAEAGRHLAGNALVNGIITTPPACAPGESGPPARVLWWENSTIRGEVGQRELGIRRGCLPDAHWQGEGGTGRGPPRPPGRRHPQGPHRPEPEP